MISFLFPSSFYAGLIRDTVSCLSRGYPEAGSRVATVCLEDCPQMNINIASHKIYNHIGIIVELREQGKSADPAFTYDMLWRFLKRFESSEVRKKAFVPRLHSAHYEEITAEIERCYNNNSSTTAIEVCGRLQTRGIFVSISHIKRLRQQLGYRRTTTKYCHTIRDVNKVARMDFCTQMLQDLTISTSFANNSTNLVDCSTRFCFAKKRNPFSRMRSRAKHPGKGPIWGGISSRGATQLAILPGSCRINSEVYCRILEKCYKPFAGSAHNGFAWIVQDNAPCHKSHYTTEKLLEWGIESLDWPAESPDLNPMSLKQRVRNLDDLKVSIIQYWKKLTPDVCQKYIAGVRKRMRQVEAFNFYVWRKKSANQ
ncbi:hypothetical protein ANCDUO_00120 [Ancylostoma duodenale]|uniref:Tc1-like transposase DDE domain-containing protein n=1 Tax=Ancylostoma duodenale TaxID=51022 RepID=A0A0C2HIX5_9BILA|nr:hypothetical protein ANCDUO_00120 [Ancylostoma duodenale]